MEDLELTLSGAPPTGQEQSSGRDGNRGNDTKIAISGFPRSRLLDGARAPCRQEIEDGLKSLVGRGTPASNPESGQGYGVITLAGHNVGASMVVGNGGSRDARTPPPGDTIGAGRERQQQRAEREQLVNAGEHVQRRQP
jgi:hypothetical protein